QPSLNLLLAGMTEVQPESSAALRHVRIERLPRHERHSAPNGLRQQGTGVHVPRQRDPEKQAARGQLPSREIAQMPLQGACEIIALASIDRHYSGQAFVSVRIA